MTYELVAIVNYCEELILMYGHLDFDTARTCMYAYETLKDLVADGDYNKFRQWRIENWDRILELKQ